MTDKKDDSDSTTIFNSLVKLTGQIAGTTVDLARDATAMTAMFGQAWLPDAMLNLMAPERLEAMAEAGDFLRDARELAGFTQDELAKSLGLSDNEVLEEVESGQTIMPLELMLRSAALLARHDPIPFLIKFMRTYNPALESRLEKWGVMALPKHIERERRFINIYRQHDSLRDLSDEEHLRFIEYMNSSTELVLDVMLKEKAANNSQRKTKKTPRTKRSK
ncbi:MAG: hypothetical protein IMF09_05335 [Proteobacteria bacterium]|nr:hypothetical protein [Pseudomonadota bacterium]